MSNTNKLVYVIFCLILLGGCNARISERGTINDDDKSASAGVSEVPKETKNSYVEDVMDDYYNGMPVHMFGFESRILDVVKNNELVFSFRDVLDIEGLKLSEGLEFYRDTFARTDLDFAGKEYGSSDIILRVVWDDNRTNAKWVYYSRILTNKYSIGNGIHVGMSVKDLESMLGVDQSNGHIILLYNSDVQIPQRYGYTVDGLSDDTLETFVDIECTADSVACITLFVRYGRFRP